MRSVEEAQAELLALCAPLERETISIHQCQNRATATDIFATHAHPPFAASAMDGYAVHGDTIAQLPATLTVVGESIAGKRFTGRVLPGEAVRIFTGAPLPADCDCVIVQEDVTCDGATITVHGSPKRFDQHIRPVGLDIAPGQCLAARGTRLLPALQGLLAAARITQVAVTRTPKLQLLACGDELKLPGDALGPDDIVASNGLILAALLTNAGACVLGEDEIIPDDLGTLTQKICASDADILITIGGASVGDRDFVQAALKNAGYDIAFWKIALKPGKPMIVGSRGKQIIIGLPGNPVSAYVCALLFVLPTLRALQGLKQPLPQLSNGFTTVDLATADTRTEYLRSVAQLHNGSWQVTPHLRQDSSMISTLAASNALLMRPAGAPAARAGTAVSFLPIDS